MGNCRKMTNKMEDRDSGDVFDSILALEEEFISRGNKEGIEVGKKQGYENGKELG